MMDRERFAVLTISCSIYYFCQNWLPPRRSLNKLDLDTKGVARKPDVLALLVSIYSSKEVFIDEYRSVLATRLLAFNDANFSIEREIATIELLKIRSALRLH